MAGVPVRAVERVPAAARRGGAQGRDLRADRGPARGEGHRRARRRARRDAGHAHRGRRARPAARATSSLAIASAAKGDRRRVGLAWVDLSTGRFVVADVEPEARCSTSSRASRPAEIARCPSDERGRARRGAERRTRPAARDARPAVDASTPRRAARALKEHFRVASLEGFGFDRRRPGGRARRARRSSTCARRS